MTEIGQDTASRVIAIPETDAAVELAWAVATHTGHRRKHNEDSFVADPPYFAVADGMGGHSAGDLASAAVVNRLSEAADGEFGTLEGTIEALRLATGDIGEIADEASLGVGTTATGAVLTVAEGAAQWLIFNVGDSRVYIADDGFFGQVTVDHSVVQEMVDAGMIKADDAESHPDSNIITRAVGFNAEPVPDFWRVPVRTGMRILVCSDGLTKEVDAAELRVMFRTDVEREELVKQLVERALSSGGKDNITVLVLDVVSAPPVSEDELEDTAGNEVDGDTAPTAPRTGDDQRA